jgi:transcriptional regulator with XRE-family HTH domain
MTFVSKYDSKRHPDTIAALARRGLTQEQIAHDLGITGRTFSTWKKQYAAVDLALKEGKQIADGQVEKALYRRACGYSYMEKKRVKLPDGTIRIETTKKEVAPDVTAQIFWLKNRNREAWRDVQGREITGKDGQPLGVSHMSDREVLERVERILKRKEKR